MKPLARGCIAEGIGTFALVFFGAGSALMAGPIGADSGGLLTVALAHAFVLIVFVTACLYISGAQFNPAVSIALMVVGRQGWLQTAAFIAAQLLAAACAAGMLVWTIGPTASSDSLGTNLGATIGSMTRDGDIRGVLVLEFLQTFALMFVIMATVVDTRAHRALSGLCVGGVVAACVLAFAPLTGSSMNPARTFGPALYGHWQLHWAYWLAPVAGAIAAAAVYRAVWQTTPEEPEY